MFEAQLLRATNWVVNRKERDGAGYIFQSGDRETREISEALLIDGVMPGDVNRMVIPLLLEGYAQRIHEWREGIVRQANHMTDTMRLMGDDPNILAAEQEVAKKELRSSGQPPFFSNRFLLRVLTNYDADSLRFSEIKYDLPEEEPEENIAQNPVKVA